MKYYNVLYISDAIFIQFFKNDDNNLKKKKLFTYIRSNIKLNITLYWISFHS